LFRLHFDAGGLVPHDADETTSPTHIPTASACATPNEFFFMFLLPLPVAPWKRGAISHLAAADKPRAR
jgi:hypothetical protein